MTNQKMHTATIDGVERVGFRSISTFHFLGEDGYPDWREVTSLTDLVPVLAINPRTHKIIDRGDIRRIHFFLEIFWGWITDGDLDTSLVSELKTIISQLSPASDEEECCFKCSTLGSPTGCPCDCHPEWKDTIHIRALRST